MTTATTPAVDLVQAEVVIKQGLVEAKQAAHEWLAKHGDRDCCGFGWTDVYGVRSNSKLGKLLTNYGFRKSYSGTLQYWDPSQSYTQSITAKEVAAQVLADALTGLGLRAYAGSRMD
jgi:hypothetical protein